MTLFEGCLLFVAAMLGGALNSVAGGGSFISFPSLMFVGVPPVNANTTSTVALWPGSIASVGAYRHDLGKQHNALLLAITSLVGGVIGALLLINTSQAAFVHLVPYLLLIATLLFAFGGAITARVGDRLARASSGSRLAVGGVVLLQLVIATYGGYFGGGLGILMLATLALMGMENIHAMNAIKTLMQACINGVAVLTFIIAGAVVWPQALLMICGAIVGGYAGAHYARKLNPRLVKWFVIFVGFAMTTYFFVRG